MKKCQSFVSENFQFLDVNFSIYLNRSVFVMTCTLPDSISQLNRTSLLQLHIEWAIINQTCLSTTQYWLSFFSFFMVTYLNFKTILEPIT